MDFDVHAQMVTFVEKCGFFDEVEMRLLMALEIAPKQGLLVSDHSSCKLLEITPNRVF